MIVPIHKWVLGVVIGVVHNKDPKPYSVMLTHEMDGRCAVRRSTPNQFLQERYEIVLDSSLFIGSFYR